jgi:hypothetical protein
METIKSLKHDFNQSSDKITFVGVPALILATAVALSLTIGIEIHKTYFNDQIQENSISSPSLKMDR